MELIYAAYFFAVIAFIWFLREILQGDYFFSLVPLVAGIILLGVAEPIAMPAFFSAIWLFLQVNFLTILAGIVVYFIIGGLYVVVWRYYAWLKDRSSEMKRDYSEFSKDTRNDKYTTEDEMQNAFLDSDVYKKRYSPSSIYSTIISWIVWWPFSLAYHLLHRPIRYLYTTIYNNIVTVLSKISRRVGKSIIR